MANHTDRLTIKIDGLGGGIHLEIASFTLVLAVNTIPTISLVVLPIEITHDKTTNITASAETIQSVTNLYQTLSGLVPSYETTATVELQVDCNNHPENVTLQDWILTDVALDTITPTGAPMINVTLAHPSIMLSKVGNIYEVYKSQQLLADYKEEITGDNLVEVLDSVYKFYANADEENFYEIADIANGGPNDEIAAKLRKIRQAMAEHLPSKYLTDETGGLIFQNILPELTDCIRVATAQLVAPTPFGNSLWKRLITEISGAFLVQVKPTYTQPQLTLAPITPWQTSSYTIGTNRITDLVTNGIDPAPIIGVAAERAAWDQGLFINAANRIAYPQFDNTYAFYMPPEVLKGDTIGEIQNIALSPVINLMCELDAGGFTISGANDPKLAANKSSIADEDKEKLGAAYAEGVFQLSYRQQCRATLATVPMFYDDARSEIYPGNILTVRDDRGGGPLYSGYISRIVTTGTSSGGGGTTFELMYCRGGEGRDDSALLVTPPIDTHPCYAGQFIP